MSNRTALEVTLSVLRDTGRIETADEAVVQALRTMAAALDGDPSNAALWRQYRAALKELRADVGGSSLDDELKGMFA